MKALSQITGYQPDTDIVLRVQEAQVRQLFTQAWVGLTGALVAALSISFVLWPVIAHWRMAGWTAALVVLSAARGFLNRAFHRHSPSGQAIFRWARLHVLGVVLAGMLWALPSIFLWPPGIGSYQTVWPICIVSISVTAVATYSAWTPSYLSFLIITMVPLTLRLLMEGGPVFPIIGMLALFFIAVLARAGKAMHDATHRALVMGIRNEALSSFLAVEKAKQEELTHKLQAAHDQLRQLSLTDELTGLWNRRYLNAAIPEILAQVIRHYRNVDEGVGKSIAANIDILFIMVDLDHFKVINDTFGHSAGDKVLKETCQLLTKSCREMDTIVRWGGEEFLVVARDINRSHYTGVVERIRKAVENHEFDIGLAKSISVTCSIGAAAFPLAIDQPERLNWNRVVDLADTCLYTAKRSARNAWVSVIPTDLATAEDFSPNPPKRLADLIQYGKLEFRTSLPSHNKICWAD